MAIRSRPPERQKRCSRCGTTFPTHYAWRQHTRRDCDGAITAANWRATREMLDKLEHRLLFGPVGADPFGRFDRDTPTIGPLPRRDAWIPIRDAFAQGYVTVRQPLADELSLDAMLAKLEELGTPLPVLKYRAMPDGMVPRGEVWLIGGAGDLARVVGTITGLAEPEKGGAP